VRDANEIGSGVPKGRDVLGHLYLYIHICEENIKMGIKNVICKSVICEDVDCIQPTQDMDRCQIPLNTIMNLGVP
jgi:hypothetical protein